MPLLAAFSSKLLSAIGISTGIIAWEILKSTVNEAKDLNDIAYSSNRNLYVRVGPIGRIQTSSDLLEWTTRSSGTTADLYAIVYDPRTKNFYTVGSSSTLLYSSNGENWTSVIIPTGFGRAFFDITLGDLDRIVIAANEGYIYYSNNPTVGSSWTDSRIVTGDAVNWPDRYSILYNGGSRVSNNIHYVLVGGSGHDAYSTQLTSGWSTMVSAPWGSTKLYAVSADETYYYVAGATGVWRTTNITSSWASMSISNPGAVYGLAFDSAKLEMVFVGASSYIYISGTTNNLTETRTLTRAREVFPGTVVILGNNGVYGVKYPENHLVVTMHDIQFGSILALKYFPDLRIYVAAMQYQAGITDTVLATSYNGKDWSIRYTLNGGYYPLEFSHIPGTTSIVAVDIDTFGGAVFASTDNGLSWSRLDFNSGTNYYVFNDLKKYIIVNSISIYSIDADTLQTLSFNSLSITNNNRLRVGFYSSNKEYIFLGQDGADIRTTDVVAGPLVDYSFLSKYHLVNAGSGYIIAIGFNDNVYNASSQFWGSSLNSSNLNAVAAYDSSRTRLYRGSSYGINYSSFSGGVLGTQTDTSAGSYQWTGVAPTTGNGWIRVGSSTNPASNRIETTTNNGLTWTAATYTFDNTPSGVKKAGSLYFVFGNASNILTSSDATTWTQRNIGLSTSLFVRDVVHDGTRYFLITSNGNQFVTSTDGITWSVSATPVTSSFFSAAHNGSGVIVAVGASGALVRWDGLSWTSYAGNAGSLTINNVIWTGTRFVLDTGTNYRYSTDGITWTLSTDTNFSATTTAMANIGSIVVAAYSSNIQVSTDGGITFTGGTAGVAGINKLATNGTTIFGVGSFGVEAFTTDGVNWTVRNSGFLIESMAVSPAGVIVVGRRGGSLAVSTDGTTFLDATPSGSWATSRPIINDVQWDSTLSDFLFLAANRLWRGNTTTWNTYGNSYNINFSSGMDFQNFVRVNSTTLLVAGQYVSSPNLYRTTDNGTNWTDISSQVTEVFIDMISVSNGTYVFAVGGGKVFRSLDQGVTWSLMFSAKNVVSLNTLAYDATNTTLIAIGTASAALFSGSTTITQLGGAALRSNDFGVTWRIDRHGHRVNDLATDFKGNVWVTGSGGIYLSSSNSGVSWLAPTEGFGAESTGLTYRSYSSIAVDNFSIIVGGGRTFNAAAPLSREYSVTDNTWVESNLVPISVGNNFRIDTVLTTPTRLLATGGGGSSSSQLVIAGKRRILPPVGDKWSYRTEEEIWKLTPRVVNNLKIVSGLLAVVGDSGAVSLSADGRIWHHTDLGFDNIFNVDSNGTTILLVGEDAAAWSSIDNGATWTNRKVQAEAIFGTISVNAITNIASNGEIFFVTGPDRNAATVSSDGSTWTSRSTTFQSGFPTYTPYQVIWAGSFFVAVGGSGTVATSPDGITWTNRTSGLTSTGWGTADIFSICWNGTLFMIGGQGGNIATSPDCITWTYRTKTPWTTFGVYSIIWDGEYFWASGWGNNLAYSVNGTTWVSKTTELANAGWPSMTVPTYLAWYQGNLVAVGGDTLKIAVSSGDLTNKKNMDFELDLVNTLVQEPTPVTQQFFGRGLVANDRFLAVASLRPSSGGGFTPTVYVYNMNTGDTLGLARTIDGTASTDGAGLIIFGNVIGYYNKTTDPYVQSFEGDMSLVNISTGVLERLITNIPLGAVAYDGQLLIGGNGGQGKVEIFNLGKTLTAGFSPDQTLSAVNEEYGSGVAMNLRFIAIGAPANDFLDTNSGAVYLWRRKEQTAISATGAVVDPISYVIYSPNFYSNADRFGSTLYMDDQYLYVHHVKFNVGTSEVYVYSLPNATRTTPLLVKVLSSTASTSFGSTMTSNDEYLFIGDDGESTERGAVYIYRKSNWSLQKKLFGPSTDTFDNFGSNIAVTGNYLVVSAPAFDSPSVNAGAVYRYRFINPTPIQPKPAIAISDQGQVVPATTLLVATTLSTSSSIRGLATDGQGVVIAVGIGGFIERSTDSGATWTTIQGTQSYNLLDVRFVKNYFVAVGTLGVVLRSINGGVTWTSGTYVNGSDSLTRVMPVWDSIDNPQGDSLELYALLMPLASVTTYSRSTNSGATWSAAQQLATSSGTLSHTIYDIRYANGFWIVATSNGIYTGVSLSLLSQSQLRASLNWLNYSSLGPITFLGTQALVTANISGNSVLLTASEYGRGPWYNALGSDINFFSLLSAARISSSKMVLGGSSNGRIWTYELGSGTNAGLIEVNTTAPTSSWGIRAVVGLNQRDLFLAAGDGGFARRNTYKLQYTEGETISFVIRGTNRDYWWRDTGSISLPDTNGGTGPLVRRVEPDWYGVQWDSVAIASDGLIEKNETLTVSLSTSENGPVIDSCTFTITGTAVSGVTYTSIPHFPAFIVAENYIRFHGAESGGTFLNMDSALYNKLGNLVAGGHIDVVFNSSSGQTYTALVEWTNNAVYQPNQVDMYFNLLEGQLILEYYNGSNSVTVTFY